MPDKERSIVLKPSWKHYLPAYLLGILLMPLIAGLFVLYRTIRKQLKTRFILKERSIQFVEGKTDITLDLITIRRTELKDGRFGTQTIQLITNTREVELYGLENADSLLRSIDKAIEAEIRRQEADKKVKVRKTTHKPGAMDKLEYLTGLWQQGLITTEEFDRQRNELES